MTSDYLCNLIIPGAAKSGTSSLHEMLGSHPEISMSTNKEPHYFCKRDMYRRGYKFHNSLFDPAPEKRVFGESSTGYLIWPDAIKSIKTNLGRPKIIMILREPVQRAFSHYRWRFRLGLEKRTFLEALRIDGYGYDPERPDGFGYKAYLQFSQYSKYCPMWIDSFGQENCLFLRSDDAKDRKILERCFAFLNVDMSVNSDIITKNTTDSLQARPPKPLNALASMLPGAFKNTWVYKKFRDRVLLGIASNAPLVMTDEEEEYVRKELRCDIEYYNSLFR